MTEKEIEDFEEDIANCYNQGMMRAPLHLDSGNILNLIRVFENVRENDWVCCTWRSHAKQLLKGVCPERLKPDILAGKSITLCYKEKKTISSAIVTGILPIAVGLSLANKFKNSPDRVWCFLGEHTAETGSFHECYNYSMAHDLNIMWVIEDNGLSVKTPTKHVWKTNLPTVIKNKFPQYHEDDGFLFDEHCKLVYFKYTSKYPHSGTNAGRVNFTF
jgi:TPP-dependent pyruvate/acetoin dehydrogenase alpha subunit